MTQHARDRLLLAGTLLLGLTLRLFRLGTESLWYDETVSAYLAGSSFPELLRHTAGDIHPPGYYVLLRGWLLFAGYPDGRADPTGYGLEWAAAFFSLFFGIALIPLAYILARRVGDKTTGLLAAAIVAFSPFNIWYSQEVRMYTLGAALGALAVYAALRALRGAPAWWAVYMPVAAAGMFTLYYFVFLLILLNAWAFLQPLGSERGSRRWLPWLAANLGVVALYLPWLSVAVRQALDPPVPPWRTPTPPLHALWETWQAVSLGQSAPTWTIPVSIMALALFIVGLARMRERSLLSWTTLGPPALILLASLLVAPLYHVRYMFIFSPMVYVALAGGLAWLAERRSAIAWAAVLIWLAAAGATLRAFWFDPLYRADNHRGAVARLYERWRPGDVVLVNAGYAYTALTTYWPEEVSVRTRLREPLPNLREDDNLVMITTGHVDGDPELGWGDPRSDFFAISADLAQEQISALFRQFPRVWHYRIYDTVSDPNGLVRAQLEENGQIVEDTTFSGEANMRLQEFVPRAGAEWETDVPEAIFDSGLSMQWKPIGGSVFAGERLFTELIWQPAEFTPDFATSVRLVDSMGTSWSQPEDERPLGPEFTASRWPSGLAERQPIALDVREGTPPGEYAIMLVVYDPKTGQPFTASAREVVSQSIELGQVTIARPERPSRLQPAVMHFGPLRLIEATSPVTQISPSGQVPIELLWQAEEAPGEPLVVVTQLIDAQGQVVAGLEEEPLQGRYPAQNWTEGELVRDRHALDVPAGLPRGDYRLIVGIYRSADRARLTGRSGDSYTVKRITVEP